MEQAYKQKDIEDNRERNKYEPESVENTVVNFLTLKGDKRFSTGVPIRLIEYQKLVFFWKELGLNKFDLEECDPRWLDEIYQTNKGIETYKANNVKGLEGQNRTMGSRGVVREKLL